MDLKEIEQKIKDIVSREKIDFDWPDFDSPNKFGLPNSQTSLGVQARNSQTSLGIQAKNKMGVQTRNSQTSLGIQAKNKMGVQTRNKMGVQTRNRMPQLVEGNFDFSLETPPSPEMGDYCFSCFKLAKVLKKSPEIISRELAGQLGKEKLALVEKVEAQGPYLNLFLNRKKFAELVISDVLKHNKNFGRGKKKKEKIMIEGFGQANTHKPLHIGHLRNIFLSEAISNLFEFSGYQVIRANYQGDIGSHVAKWLWYFNKSTDRQILQKNVSNWLADIYTKASDALAENPEDKKEIAEILNQLESGNPKLKKIWEKTRKLSLKEFARIYKLLGVKFDVDFFESKMEKPGKKIVAELLKRGVAKISEGAVIVDLEKYDLGIFLLLKSDGASLYSTKDLALAKNKFKKYKIDKSIYVVDVRQSLYLKQLFKTLELMGFEQAVKCHHLSYGFVSLAGSKMSSRTGEVVAAEELYNKVKEKVLREIKKRGNINEKEQNKIADEIVLGALKFDMLRFSPELNIDFNWEKALQFEGDTGPYLQYAGVRIQSIIKKFKNSKIQRLNIRDLKFNHEEWELVKKISHFPELVKKSAEEYNPTCLTNYLLELTSLFNKFYEKCSVLKAETNELKYFRLALIEAVAIVLKSGLALLGIEMPKKM